MTTEVPEDLKYTKEHEWLRVENARARIGITDYAQNALTDIVFVELPEVGTEIDKGGILGTVESVKATSDIYSPVSGTIVEVNVALTETPELINKEPYGNGWLVVIELRDRTELEELMSPAQYKELLSTLEEG
jgi:glycine cleavage system H protein